MANLNPCDPRKLLPQNFYSAKVVPLENLAPYSIIKAVLGRETSCLVFLPWVNTVWCR